MGQTRINHMFFMDDLKLFGKSERQIESLVNTVHAVSDDIGMEWYTDYGQKHSQDDDYV